MHYVSRVIITVSKAASKCENQRAKERGKERYKEVEGGSTGDWRGGALFRESALGLPWGCHTGQVSLHPARDRMVFDWKYILFACPCGSELAAGQATGTTGTTGAGRAPRHIARSGRYFQD